MLQVPTYGRGYEESANISSNFGTMHGESEGPVLEGTVYETLCHFSFLYELSQVERGPQYSTSKVETYFLGNAAKGTEPKHVVGLHSWA